MYTSDSSCNKAVATYIPTNCLDGSTPTPTRSLCDLKKSQQISFCTGQIETHIDAFDLSAHN
jgi:hypothetical protein